MTLVSTSIGYPEQGVGAIHSFGNRELVVFLGRDPARFAQCGADGSPALLAPFEKELAVVRSEHGGHEAVAVVDGLRLLRSFAEELGEPLFGTSDLPGH
jgi:hypothetical protein